MEKGDVQDPKGLIFESFRIEGITKPECRTIFLDWALSLPLEQNANSTISQLLARYQPDHPDHPMTEVLNEGLHNMSAPRRRGGWRNRVRN
ncbi:hypothetical protein [Sulfitobacter pacificus]|uniref:Uncharacterized protein n=1 Tax=Sulfitobacter pacificus TaxID=1499314 RepID=A0ABQ5VH86_9RHOB|nr:hypothetical protein [Sulfitobacter pacificus]GLQ26451.1 hypothetical protein GCM10007927_12540 [Sulfitobacter pacificus]